ncbi:MAG: ribosome biogenesis GTP-binding protein YihA/YsxC [Oscillospiraceae bacterium]|nr:ribosome biogenesis GTP-binding protein YihA/YsxC [Oscillospiraceae bacterium]
MDAAFVLSAAREEQFIRDGKKTVVFAGRSNVGKSSVINTLTGRKNLAKVGNTPGKTAHVNYFLINDTYFYADLPGYGYAKVSHAEKLRWAALLEAFFAEPDRITLGVLVADARHKPTALDCQMAEVFRQKNIPFITVANKADKLKPSQLLNSIQLIQETLAVEKAMPLSSVTGKGKEEILFEIRIRLLGGQ